MNAKTISIVRSIDEQLMKSADDIISSKLEKLNQFSRYCYSSSEIAKGFCMSGADLNSFLSDKGIILKINGQWCLARKYQSMHLAEYRYSLKYNQKGQRKLKATLVWTEDGREFIHKLVYRS